MRNQVSLKIYGRVQGVFFRDSVRESAEKLKLTGWVKNELDGTVKVLAQGEENSLKELIEWCYNGPELAQVDKIDIDWQKIKEDYQNFQVIYH